MSLASCFGDRMLRGAIGFDQIVIKEDHASGQWIDLELASMSWRVSWIVERIRLGIRTSAPSQQAVDGDS